MNNLKEEFYQLIPERFIENIKQLKGHKYVKTNDISKYIEIVNQTRDFLNNQIIYYRNRGVDREEILKSISEHERNLKTQGVRLKLRENELKELNVEFNQVEHLVRTAPILTQYIMSIENQVEIVKKEIQRSELAIKESNETLNLIDVIGDSVENITKWFNDRFCPPKKDEVAVKNKRVKI